MKRILLTATIFLFACRQERLYEVNQAVPAALWNEKKVFFSVLIFQTQPAIAMC